MIFIARNKIAAPPWQRDPTDPARILDRFGRIVCRVYQKSPRLTVDQSLSVDTVKSDTPPVDIDQGHENYQANLAVIEKAPELLAALKEAAFILDSMGIPLAEPFYNLIDQAQPDQPALKPINRDQQKEPLPRPRC